MENAKKAMKLAEEELQEKEVSVLKKIIKSLLQKKQDKEKEKDELEEEIKLIKQEIDDFKAGRLDKIKERHEINPKADKIEPIKIIIINDNRRTNYPTQPWKWNYSVDWNYYPTHSNIHYQTSDLTGANGLIFASGYSSLSTAVTMCGTSAQAFTGGTYEIGKKTINL